LLNGLNVGLIVIFIGLYGMTRTKNSLKLLMCLSIMGSGVILLFVSLGYIPGAVAPIADSGSQMVDPLPQSVMVTAIVIDLATVALGLAMVHYLYETYHTLNFDRILKKEEMKDDN